MNLLNLFWRKSSAPIARERLQILLAHERIGLNPSHLLAALRDGILAVIGKHVTIDPEKVHVKMGNAGTVSTLEVDIEIPNSAGGLVAVTT